MDAGIEGDSYQWYVNGQMVDGANTSSLTLSYIGNTLAPGGIGSDGNIGSAGNIGSDGNIASDGNIGSAGNIGSSGNIGSAGNTYSTGRGQKLMPDGTKKQIAYIMYSYELSPEEATDNFSFEIVKNAGGAAIASANTSVAEYFDFMLGSRSYEEYWPIVKAFANYTSACQMLFNYNTDELINDSVSNMTADEKSVKNLTKDEVESYVIEPNSGYEGLTYKGSSLLVGSSITIRHYFEASEDLDINSLVFVAGSGQVNISKKSKYYYVDIEGVSPYEYLDNKSLTICQGQKRSTIDYCVMNYIAKAVNMGTDAKLVGMVSSLYRLYEEVWNAYYV